VNHEATGANFIEVQMTSIGFATDDTADDTAHSSGLEDFDAGPIFLETN
jgi:hypothetical protein